MGVRAAITDHLGRARRGEPGQTQALNCIPDGKYGKYKKVTAEAI
jgi:hypothetical protein